MASPFKIRGESESTAIC